MSPKLELGLQRDGAAAKKAAMTASEGRSTRRYGFEGAVGTWCNDFSVDRWSPREIHKHIVGRSLPCDERSSVCRAACLNTSADTNAGPRTLPTNRVLTGRVSHMEGKGILGGGSGVGVEFFCWEAPQRAVH
jgi:hypothetical protein